MQDEIVNSTINFSVTPLEKNNEASIEQNQEVNLSNILDGHLEEIGVKDDIDAPAAQQLDGMCVECGDQPAVVYCEQCLDDFCEVCFTHQHRKGTRAKHTLRKLKGASFHNAESSKVSENHRVNQNLDGFPKGGAIKATILRAFKISGEQEVRVNHDITMDDIDITASEFISTQATTLEEAKAIGESFLERAKYIPLRLSYEERKYLRLLEAGLNVSEYTDKIDILSYSQVKSKRIVAQIKELCSILSGLVLAADYNVGQELFKDRDFENNKEFFQVIFELGRRHKIMNPEKMRSTYGKLVYMLQDSQITDVYELLGFKCVKPICTVFNTLETHQALSILHDPLIEAATAEIIDEGKSRREVQSEIKKKERCIEYFAKKYGKREGLTPDIVRQCLYSIGDNNAFLRYLC
jgi:hypothetical protein